MTGSQFNPPCTELKEKTTEQSRVLEGSPIGGKIYGKGGF